ncbi:Pyridoxamine 5'-phosphate oxidase [Streptomyces sp. YIM 121038]|uniref:pyridoxamine 5'-phosphate oxidase family protein n=1 Tax=Streptomyces sp. YIM 121038 TaxID=2136401 RepID=UPI0011108126|nr:pyridoxamine 5'-phosphate oxidase family protein [Streptomyces sp. YIM 121038]QCX73891.1 Pyridoxamine 5'-phosphate oxidase [Streptomyces sp. YIM 121038]
MSTAPAPRRLVRVSGAEALYLLEGSRTGRLVHVRNDTPVLRPAAHVLEYGRLVVRAPVPRTALPAGATVTYHVDEIRTAIGTGWSVSASGPVAFVSDPDEVAHYRRTLPGWTHGPHDTLLRLDPQTVSGFRLARVEA